MVENLKYASYYERLHIIVIPTLQLRRLRAEMIQVFKILNEDIDTGCFFTVYSDSCNRRYPFRLKRIRGNASSSSRKVQLQKSEDKCTALVVGM